MYTKITFIFKNFYYAYCNLCLVTKLLFETYPLQCHSLLLTIILSIILEYNVFVDVQCYFKNLLIVITGFFDILPSTYTYNSLLGYLYYRNLILFLIATRGISNYCCVSAITSIITYNNNNNFYLIIIIDLLKNE